MLETRANRQRTSEKIDRNCERVEEISRLIVMISWWWLIIHSPSKNRYDCVTTAQLIVLFWISCCVELFVITFAWTSTSSHVFVVRTNVRPSIELPIQLGDYSAKVKSTFQEKKCLTLRFDSLTTCEIYHLTPTLFLNHFERSLEHSDVIFQISRLCNLKINITASKWRKWPLV